MSTTVSIAARPKALAGGASSGIGPARTAI